MNTSVVISTYNSPAWLEKVLWGFFAQTRKDFEIVIADDGSREETRLFLKDIARRSPVPMLHMWQPDDGFQKNRILNKSIASARGERVLMTDGDCVPRQDFVEMHSRLARPDCFLTGGYFKLNRRVSEAITETDVTSQSMFTTVWLLKKGLPPSAKFLKIMSNPSVGDWLNRITPARPTWNGHSASCLRSQAIAVNGFNEVMQYGGEDVEFGFRLRHMGIEPRRIRYSTVTVHLFHGHGYVTPEMRQRGHQIMLDTLASKRVRTEVGIDQWLASDGLVRLAADDRAEWLKR
jgi:glycosyltransferase involved in cell wall biosynthesis